MSVKFPRIFIAILCILGIVSCSKESFRQSETHIFKESIEEDGLDFFAEVFWLGPENEDYNDFVARSSFAPDIESASIIVLDGTLLAANKDLLDEAYRKSKIIVLCDPDFKVYNDIAETSGWPIGSCDEEKSELFAFSLAGTSSLMTPEDLVVINEPELLPDSDSDMTIPDAEPDEDGIIEKYKVPDYDELIDLNHIIDPFVKMVNQMFVNLDCITKADNNDNNDNKNIPSYGNAKVFPPVRLKF